MMSNGPGVSVDEVAGKWRVRWRETVNEGGVERRVQRSRTCETQRSAIELRAKVLRTIEGGGIVEDERRTIPTVCTVDAIAAAYVRHLAGRGRSASTIRGAGYDLARVLVALRSILKVPEGTAVPATEINAARITEVTNHLRRELAPGTLAHTIGTWVRAWVWASDDPTAYPGVLTPPRNTEALHPEAPIYSAGEAPTLEHVDAVIRRLSDAPVARPAAIIARSTGLRISQVLALTVRDFLLCGDRPSVTLTSSMGKSKREKANPRTIPIPLHLRDYVAVLCADKKPTDRVVGRGAQASASTHVQATLRDAWQAATDAGEVPEQVWNPPNREHARPSHAFRAAYQSHLVHEGVRDETIDALVGHHTLRSSHYVEIDARGVAMRAAVATIYAPVLVVVQPSNVIPPRSG